MDWEKLGMISPILIGSILFVLKDLFLDRYETMRVKRGAPKIARQIMNARITVASLALIVVGIINIVSNL